MLAYGDYVAGGEIRVSKQLFEPQPALVLSVSRMAGRGNSPAGGRDFGVYDSHEAQLINCDPGPSPQGHACLFTATPLNSLSTIHLDTIGPINSIDMEIL